MRSTLTVHCVGGIDGVRAANAALDAVRDAHPEPFSEAGGWAGATVGLTVRDNSPRNIALVVSSECDCGACLAFRETPRPTFY